ncbi:MAG TPA: aminotransferase class I/II-fold pyridoxal phosphate-dependent enzyme [Gemmatimonadaceae bacterium]|nr:aminotransferase class I/II-fold pyridoxal phosphate-dependent enzyme [Gemmatimonadaceae bacterium]
MTARFDDSVAQRTRIYLSPPHVGEEERRLVMDAIDSNWVAPLGPHVEAFEQEFGTYVGASQAVALSSGTAAIHLALLAAGVGVGDEVLVSTFTFAATANPVVYVGARPTFIDSERESWNMDPALLEDVLKRRGRRNQLPKAVILVHLYGQSADTDAIRALCDRHGVLLIEDAAEAVGARYKGRAPGIDGWVGVYSFNGNKIITTSGGGMLVTRDAAVASRVRFLATQARDPEVHYQHSAIGYNYRLSNLLAALGRGQLRALEDRVTTRRRIFETYRDALATEPGLSFMPEATWGDARSRATRWLTCVEIDPEEFSVDRETVRLALEGRNVESRPVWKPLHLQPVFASCEFVGPGVAEDIFDKGLCLPSGTALTRDQLETVIDVVRTARRTSALRV